MKIKDIYEVIKKDTGIDIKLKNKKHEDAFLRRAFIALCYRYADEFITIDKLKEYLPTNNNIRIKRMLVIFKDDIRFNPEYSKQFNYLNNILSLYGELRQPFKHLESLDALIKQV